MEGHRERSNKWKNKIYQDWRNAVLQRDNYRCTICGDKENLHAHHIEPYLRCIERRFDVTNGQTLCRQCHARIDHLGRKASLETRLKMRESQRGRKWSEEARKRFSEKKKGSVVKQEVRERISKKLLGNIPWSKGKKFTEDHKKKLREAKIGHVPWNKGKKFTKEHEEKHRKEKCQRQPIA